MPTRDRELDLRHRLRDGMRGRWLLTWHEDGRVNPGVPDVSYVITDKVYNIRHETGWLELKVAKEGTVQVEPAQHQWMRLHAGLVPAHFLIEHNDRWFLVDGVMSAHLDHIIAGVQSKSMVAGDFDTLARHLSSYTRRRYD